MINIFRSPKFSTASNQHFPGPDHYHHSTNNHHHTTSSFFANKMKRNLLFQKQNKLVGPGTYFNTQQPKCPQKPMKSKSNNLCPLKSPRQQILKQQLKKLQFQRSINEIMKQNRGQNDHTGKLIGIKQRRQFQQRLDQQILPSIPSAQHSFGYRFDSGNNKLINNANPKILFSNNLNIGGQKEFYFQRIRAQETAKGCFINSSVKRFTSEMNETMKHPDPTTYSSEKYNAISSSLKVKDQNKQKNPRNALNKLDKGHKNVDLLRLNKLQRDFKYYIDQDKISLSQLSKMKERDECMKRDRKDMKKDDQEQKKQFFLSKQERFKSNSVKKTDVQQDVLLRQSLQKQFPLVKNSQKKQLFKLGSQRFKEESKQKIGPGSYNPPSPTKNSSILLNQYQQRFSDTLCEGTPGPGQYNPKEHGSENKSPVHSRPHKDYGVLIHPLKKQKPLSSLYQQIGKEMNYFEKVFKLNNKSQNKLVVNLQRKVNREIKLNDINDQTKKILHSDNMPQQNAHKKDMHQKQNIKRQTVNYKHLYNYNTIQKDPLDLGPGHYNLKSSFNKKSFNKTIQSRA